MNKKTIRCLLAALLALTLVVSVFPQIPAQAETWKQFDKPGKSWELTVSTQAAINNAIASNDIKKINIITPSDANFTIKGDASGKTIIANTPNANLTVKGAVNSLYINAASGVELNKNADISKIKITASDNLTLNIKSGASVNNLTVGASNNDAKAGSISITNNGSINNLRLNSEDSSVSLKNNKSIGKILLGAPTELDISGKSKNNTPVTVKKAAEGSTITASTAISVNAYASADLNLKMGAGKSAVKVKLEDIDINILNDTKKDIFIIDKNSGASTAVEAGSSMTAENFQNSISDFLVKKAAEAEAAKKAAAELEAARKAAAEKAAAEKAAAEQANQSPIPPTSPTTYSERQDIIELHGLKYPCTVKETMTGGRYIATVWTVSEKDYLEVYNASSPNSPMTEDVLHSTLGIGPYLVKKEAYSYTNNQFELTTNIYNRSESLKACTTIVRYNKVMPDFRVDTPCYEEEIEYNRDGTPKGAIIVEKTDDSRKETKITYQKDGTAEQIASGRYNKIETIEEYKNGKEIPFKSTTNMWKRDSEDLEKTEIIEFTFDEDDDKLISKKTVTLYTYDESKNVVIFGFNTYYYDYPCNYDKVQSEWSSLEKLSVFKNNDINMPTKKECESNGSGKISESDFEYNDDGTLSKDTTKLYTGSAVSSTEVSQYTYAGSKKTKTKTTYRGASTVDTDMISKYISIYDLVEGAETLVKEEIYYIDFNENNIPEFAREKYRIGDDISYISSSTAWNSANEKTFERIGYKKVNDGEDKILYSEVITKIDDNNIISEYDRIYHEETKLLDPVYEYQKNADYGNDRKAYCSETSYQYNFAIENEYDCTKKVYYWENSDKYKSDDPYSYIYLLKTESRWIDNEWVVQAYGITDKNGSYLGKTNLYISTIMDSCLLSEFSDGSYGVTFSGPAVPGWITNIKIVSNGEDGCPDYSNPYYCIETITDENDRIYSENRFIQYGESDSVLEYEFTLGDGCYNGSSTIPTKHEITEYELNETTHAQTKKTVLKYENGELTSSTTYTYSLDGNWVEDQ